MQILARISRFSLNVKKHESREVGDKIYSHCNRLASYGHTRHDVLEFAHIIWTVSDGRSERVS